MSYQVTPTAFPHRSTFVTAVAWVFIVLASVSTAGSALQSVFLDYMSPLFEQAMMESPDADQLPVDFDSFMFVYRMMILGVFLISATTLVSAIGLLQRKNWARIVFIAMLGLGIVMEIVGISLSFWLPSFMAKMAAAPMEVTEVPMPEVVHRLIVIVRIFSLIVAIGLVILFAWIIRKLTGEKIRQEFQPEFQV